MDRSAINILLIWHVIFALLLISLPSVVLHKTIIIIVIINNIKKIIKE